MPVKAAPAMDRAVYSVKDIAARYNVGDQKAYRIMKLIEYVNDGLTTPGRVLWSELEYYETRRGRRPGEKNIPTAQQVHDWELGRIAPGSWGDGVIESDGESAE